MNISKEELNRLLDSITNLFQVWRKIKLINSRMPGVERDVCERLAKGLIVYYATKDDNKDWAYELSQTEVHVAFRLALGNQHLAVKYDDL